MNRPVDRYLDRFPTLAPRPELFPTGLTVLRAIVAARWLAWGWMVGIVIAFRDELRHPFVAVVAVAATLALAGTSTGLLRSRPAALIHLPFVLTEAGFAIGLSIVDGYVYENGHVFATTQSIATQWPLLAAASAGLAFGPIVAAVLGSLIGPAELGGAIANDFDEWGTGPVVSICATSLFYAACGAVFGWQTRLLKRVEGEIADRRARDEVGRVMHDTVLQTLALVERRSATHDPELAAAARQADLDLRTFLFGSASRDLADLETRVRAVIERVRRAHPGAAAVPVSVSVIDDGCRLSDDQQELIARAIGEAVANALEHAAPNRVVVFVETDERGQVFASVHDDGAGFDPAAARDGHGIDESIIARIESIGGRATITSSDAGTEVCLWSSQSD